MSDYEEDSIVVQSFPNFSLAESLGDAYRAEAADPVDCIQWNYCKIPPLYDGPPSWFKYGARGSSNTQIEAQKGVDGSTRDALEQCMTACGEATGFKAKKEMPCTKRSLS